MRLGVSLTRAVRLGSTELVRSMLRVFAGYGSRCKSRTVAYLCSNRAATRVNLLKDRKGDRVEIRLFAAILQTPERPSKVSRRLCTAEAKGSSPLGSTSERGCLSALTGKQEPWSASRIYYCNPLPSRVFYGAARTSCTLQSRSRATTRS